MGSKRSFSAKYRFLLALCRLFKLQRVMELPPEGLPDSPNMIPVDMFVPAVNYLRQKKHIERINIYGQSMGSVFAILAAQYIGGFENLIMVSPTHVPFEGTLKDKKTMTGHSVATWCGYEIPYVKADFSIIKAAKYYSHPDADHKVLGMWIAYHDAYADYQSVARAELSVEKTNARILLIAGGEDEAWPAEYSVRMIEQRLRNINYSHDVKTLIYPHGSHLNGLVPNKDREKKLYRMLPLIGLMYKSFGRYKAENLSYLEQSEKEIIEWIR